MDPNNLSRTAQQPDNAQSPPEQQTAVTTPAVQVGENQPTGARLPSPALEHAYWAEIEEDLSVPDEAEMKEIESRADKDYSAHERRFSVERLVVNGNGTDGYR